MTWWGQIVCNCCHGNQPFTTSTQFEHGSQSGLQRESKSCSYHGDGDLMFSVTMVMEHGDSGSRSVCLKKPTENKQTGRLQIIVNFYWTTHTHTHTHTHTFVCALSVSGGRGFSERRRSYVEHCTNNELADAAPVRINIVCLNLMCLFVDTTWEHRASSVDRMSFTEMSKYLSFASLNIHLVWCCDVKVSLQLQSIFIQVMITQLKLHLWLKFIFSVILLWL